MKLENMAPGVSTFTHGIRDTLHPILGRADYSYDCFLISLSFGVFCVVLGT